MIARLARLLCLLLVTAWLTSAATALAQSGTAVRNIARELTETLGQRSARELAEVGGEAAVREVVENAAREGGEQLAREVAAYGNRYGAQALRAFRSSPAAMTASMKKVPAEFTEGAMRAAAREPETIARLASNVGEDALVVAAKHPGVGTDIASKLGREGCAVAKQLSTPDAIRLARLSDDLARLPAPDRAGLLTRMNKAPTKVIDYLEKHPIVLTTAAGTAAYMATAYLAIDALLGDTENPGFLERMSDKFRTPLGVVLIVLALLVFARAAWWWNSFRSRRRVGQA